MNFTGKVREYYGYHFFAPLNSYGPRVNRASPVAAHPFNRGSVFPAAPRSRNIRHTKKKYCECDRFFIFFAGRKGMIKRFLQHPSLVIRLRSLAYGGNGSK